MSERFLLTIEYDGTHYSGWQRQLNGPSIQQEVEHALHRLTGQRAAVTGASRTDAGVHALGQCAHVDLDVSIPPDKLPFALNTLLPRDIRVLQGERVGPAFHARFQARGKEYAYRIFNRRHPSALRRHFAAHVALPLDDAAMARAAQDLVGTHDFAAFQAAGGTAKTTVRTITSAALTREGDELLLTIQGNAFLYNMVRIIAGTLIYVGLHKLPEDAFARAIETGDRLLLGPTAPPQGLCLNRVYYEGEAL
ncbi:MAG: tRNA pseudouridine(38-40) synthase TruA [Clostridiales bacterium]|nr:tRNA pseudouridine(38-40) synthase TruA [Clostridiales bacterium]